MPVRKHRCRRRLTAYSRIYKLLISRPLSMLLSLGYDSDRSTHAVRPASARL